MLGNRIRLRLRILPFLIKVLSGLKKIMLATCKINFEHKIVAKIYIFKTEDKVPTGKL
jgi:hypothetical protein